MASKSTQDFRAMIANQSTKWLQSCGDDWKANGTSNIQSRTTATRCVAMVRAELAKRTPRPMPVDISYLVECGTVAKLSNSVRCY